MEIESPYLADLISANPAKTNSTTKQDRRSVSFGGTKPKASSGYWRTKAPIPASPIPNIVIPSYLM